MNLNKAECVYQYVFSEFRQLHSPISQKLEKAFRNRVSEGPKTTLVYWMLFLKNPSFWDKEIDSWSQKIHKRQIKVLAKDLVNHLFPEDVVSHNPIMDLNYDDDDDIELF